MRKIIGLYLILIMLPAITACSLFAPPNPPEWSYEVLGDRVILTDNANPKAPQQELLFEEAVYNDANRDYFVRLIDMNFDGLTDVAILSSQDEYNTFYDCWLYDAAAKGFTISEDLSVLSNAVFDAETLTISAVETIAKGMWVESQYMFEDGVLMLTSSESFGKDKSVTPIRMRIPALTLDYEVQDTGATKTGAMIIVPELTIISWYRSSAIPGNEGNAILGGHNMWGGVRSPLFTLDELIIGDEMEMDYSDGTSLKFCLESVFVYPLATAPADLILDLRGDARVTLITCKGPFNTRTGTSDNRIVAVFKDARTFAVPDPPIEPFPPREQ